MLVKRNNKIIDDGVNLMYDSTTDTLDMVSNNLDKLGEVPVVGKASGRFRKRVTSITKPISRLLKGRKKKNPEGESG